MATITPFRVPYRSLSLAGAVTAAEAGALPRALAIHGGGVSTHRGVQYLLSPLAEHGLPVAAFDCVGHGETGGSLSDSSLDDRVQQALAVARHLGMAPPVALIGTSMGGHIACRLIDHLRPQALVLYCPAAYSADAEPLPFGPELQRCLRATADFTDSPAFEALGRFEGRLLLVLGDDDTVIPPAVIQQYRSRARRAARVEVLGLPADHKLHRWLETRPAEADRVLQRVLATLHG